MSDLTIAGLLSEQVGSSSPAHELTLDIAGVLVRVRAREPEGLAPLASYFRSLLREQPGEPDFTIDLVQRHPLQLPLDWQDWPREAGKSGLKERFVDLPDGRLIWKVRTGMLFALTPTRAAAIGPCDDNSNQVINLVNNQYIAQVMDGRWALCHAAGIGLGDAGLGLAGVSGAGKSTLALRLIEQGASFVSNDRLLVSRMEDQVLMRGIPKQPRVNPGTLLSLPSLAGIVSAARASELESLPREELWDLEEKYDVDIEAVYGEGRQAAELPLRAFAVLTWSHRSREACQVTRTTLRDAPELLGPIMKHPGPFFHQGGVYDTQGSVGELDPAPYLEALGDLPLLSFSGGVDFDRALAACQEALA